MNFKSINLLALIAFCSFVLFVKLIIFKNTVPGIDQAFYIGWYQDIINFKNIFPIFYEENLLINFSKQENTFFSQLFLKLYNSPDQYFRILNNLFFIILTYVLGNGIIGFNISSIFINTLIFVFFIYKYLKKNINFSSVLILILFLSTNNYLFFFSVLGTHNFSILILLICFTYLINQNICKNTFYNWSIWIAILFLFFSHIYNAFIVTSYISLILISNILINYKKGIKYKLINLFILGSLYIPFILISIYSNNFFRMIEFSELNSNVINSIYSNILIFFSNYFKMFSFHEYILFILISLFFFSKIKNFNRIIFFFFITVLIFLLVPGFSNGWERTLLYTYVPFIIFIYEIMSKENMQIFKNTYKILKLILIVFICINSISLFNILKNNDEKKLLNINYKFVNTLDKNQKNFNSSRDLIYNEEFDNLVFYNYHSLNVYKSLYYEHFKEPFRNNNNIIVQTLNDRLKVNKKELDEYLNKRNKKLPNDIFHLFMFLPSDADYKKNICNYLEFINLNCKKIINLLEYEVKYVTKEHMNYKFLIIKVNTNV